MSFKKITNMWQRRHAPTARGGDLKEDGWRLDLFSFSCLCGSVRVSQRSGLALFQQSFVTF